MRLPLYKFTLTLGGRFRRLRRLGRGFGGLSHDERCRLLMALLLLPATVVGLRLFGFKRWYAWLYWWGQRRQSPPPTTVMHSIRRTHLLLHLAMRYAPHRGNCLSQSLTLWWLLQRQGIASDLRVGVRQEDGVFQAHAWLEYAGQPLNDSRNVQTRYTVFEQALLPVSTQFL